MLRISALLHHRFASEAHRPAIALLLCTALALPHVSAEGLKPSKVPQKHLPRVENILEVPGHESCRRIMADDGDERTFKSLGVCDQLLEACENMGWKTPSKIQAEAIPHALEGRDVIGLAQTGSGKTGAFALPIIQALLDNPQPFFACILSPTRELAIQISQQFEALGSAIGLKCSVVSNIEIR
ncbi:hypothetical protein HPP92_002014 [Vanilla planifolia]|uniref:RNA helicase n=1 Tax=Vanilla planifolia TaxID=51239 RepID=A0A835SD03_VANPL|nr:hypothetical protein HPP92_002014 [Vanilla planifolia]